MTQQTEKFKYTLCGRPGTCCPVVEQISEDVFTITDDFGGKVQITKEQMSLMQPVLDHINAQKLTL